MKAKYIQNNQSRRNSKPSPSNSSYNLATADILYCRKPESFKPLPNLIIPLDQGRSVMLSLFNDPLSKSKNLFQFVKAKMLAKTLPLPIGLYFSALVKTFKVYFVQRTPFVQTIYLYNSLLKLRHNI